MTDMQMFRASLRNYPGVKLACWWTAMTAFAMAAAEIGRAKQE